MKAFLIELIGAFIAFIVVAFVIFPLGLLAVKYIIFPWLEYLKRLGL